jgi:hypothetical protein
LKCWVVLKKLLIGLEITTSCYYFRCTGRMKKLIVYILTIFIPIAGFSQKTNKEGKVQVVGEDISTPGYLLNDVVIQGDNSEYLKNYRTTRYFVRRVYAYSQLASAMLHEYQDSIAQMSSKREKSKYLKHANKELKEEFGEEIKNMSVTRGVYLNKLVFRETGLSTYDIIRDYRGGGKAVFIQSLCLLNGQNLKITYSPEGEDIIIERVIKEIESGKIKTLPRTAVTEKGREFQKKNRTKNKRKRSDVAAR